MKCPFCKHEDTQVLDTRVSEEGDAIRRRRRCAACDKRFTTYERIELTMPAVVKKKRQPHRIRSRETARKPATCVAQASGTGRGGRAGSTPDGRKIIVQRGARSPLRAYR